MISKITIKREGKPEMEGTMEVSDDILDNPDAPEEIGKAVIATIVMMQRSQEEH